MRYKVGQFGSGWVQIAKFLPKNNFLVNLNVKFMYQLHPIMLLKILQISLEWVMKYIKLHNYHIFEIKLSKFY